jgi:peptidoglycan/LPS O-acetylase OafA/YrhL
MSDGPPQELILPGCRIRLPFWTGLLTVLQLIGAVYALRLPPDVSDRVSQPTALMLIGGLLWAFLFGVVTVNLIQERRYAKRIAIACIVIFTCYTVARWVIFTRADYDQARLPVLIFGTFCVVTILVASYYDLKAGRPQRMEKSSDDIGP